MAYSRGAVVKGPDLFAGHDHRPYVRLSDDTHPFSDEEALYAAVTRTRRQAAVPLTNEDVATGSLPRESYVNPWTIASIKHADVQGRHGRLVRTTTETIAQEAARYLGVPGAARRR